MRNWIESIVLAIVVAILAIRFLRRRAPWWVEILSEGDRKRGTEHPGRDQ